MRFLRHRASYPLLVLAMLVVAITTRARDGVEAEALQKTQELLTDRSQRMEAIKSDPKAAKLNSRIERMTGSAASTDKIYSLSAEIMADLVKQTGGDTAKLQKLVDEAKKNPEAFGAHLSPEQRSKIRGLASEIESRKKP